ncbi:hypothetical protein [Cupriavidus sp. H39]|uniref:hypothetical protein n=1 Tax=Cupriavidus sp. H39 TaxID=3401635 RepID=UPI003CFE8441
MMDRLGLAVAALHALNPGLVTAPTSTLATVYRPWATRDGLVVIVMLSQAEFEGRAHALGVRALLQHQGELDDVISDIAVRDRGAGSRRLRYSMTYPLTQDGR